MATDKKQAGNNQQQEDPLQKINLDDYAGDEADHDIATDRAQRYMDDIDRAREQGANKPGEEQPE